MTTTELLKEIMKDSIFKETYGIPKESLEDVSFDEDSGYPIVEVLKMIIQLKDSSVSDALVYKNIKQNIFNIAD